MAGIDGEVVGGDIQVRPVPQGVAARGGAAVDGSAGVLPRSGGRVGAEDVETRRGRVPQDRPPATVVEPELALGFGPGRGGVRPVEVLVLGTELWACRGCRRGHAEQGERDCRDAEDEPKTPESAPGRHQRSAGELRQWPDRFTTEATVRRRIRTSLPSEMFRRYATSSRVRSSNVRAFRPPTCQRPVIPGVASRR